MSSTKALKECSLAGTAVGTAMVGERRTAADAPEWEGIWYEEEDRKRVLKQAAWEVLKQGGGRESSLQLLGLVE
jgi:hypothetical protein